MPTSPTELLDRITGRLAPLERARQHAYWAAATDARPETSDARARAEEAWLAALGDRELFAEVEAALAAGAGEALTTRALAEARRVMLANQVPEDLRAGLVRSDLHPRPGKDQHAFCIDIDRGGDVRVLANVTAGEQWLDTMLHELGHAVYDDHVARPLPWMLRRPPHALATEAVALMLGRLRRDPEFLVGVAGADPAAARVLGTASRQVLRTGTLVFARWCLVMVRFEQALYADPGQDLSATWWDLVEGLQHVHRPEGRAQPDWASKTHLAVSPVYYQSYLLGELLAAQLDRAVRAGAGGFVNRPEAGRFLVERVFAPGASLAWMGLIESATGRPLTPEAFVAGLER